MIQIEHASTYAWEAAIRGMRNPLDSWEKSDTVYDVDGHPIIGAADMELMQKLVRAGSDHAKFMRQILVSMDIVAPLYWWKECDTYKVGTVTNSCSTMHTVTKKRFSATDFSTDRLNFRGIEVLDFVIGRLNQFRDLYIETGDVEWWEQIIQTLPSSYNQRRTLTANYEVLRNMYHARKNHKLKEWRDFCNWIRGLPYAELITVE